MKTSDISNFISNISMFLGIGILVHSVFLESNSLEQIRTLIFAVIFFNIAVFAKP